MKNLSITGAALTFVALSIVAGIALILVSVLVSDDARNVQQVWRQFDATRSEKARALNELKRELGYGGLIHHFKDYILRAEPKRLPIVEQKIGAAKAAIDRYRTFGIRDAEDQALKDIDKTLTIYRAALEVARQLIAEGKPSVVVDRTSAVYSRPMLEALDVLRLAVHRPGERSSGQDKAVLLNELHQAMGYGGMIHEFKLFVLRNVREHAERMRIKIATSNAILKKYQAIPLTPGEQRALAAVQHVVDAYGSAINDAVLLAKNKHRPREIDRRVSIDDAPALAGFATLTRELVAQNQAAAISLAASIQRIQKFAREQLRAVIAILILLIAVEFWLFFGHIIRPLGRLNQAMLQLAAGNLDIAIPVAGPRTEIGRMAGAMEVFRTNAVARERAEAALRDHHRSIELLHRITAPANEAETVEEAIKICLDEISADTGWPVGHAYLHRPENGVDLAPSKVWHLDEPDRFAAFREVTERTGFKRGEGLPGRVLESGQAAWIVDVTKDADFPRARLTQDIGVKAGFAFPVSVGDRVIAVLEFFAADAAAPDQRTLEVMANVGAVLGSLIFRKQSEQQLRASEQSLAATLNASPIGVSIVDDDGIRLFVNSSYADMYGRPAEDLIGAQSRTAFADPAARDRLREELDRTGLVRDMEVEMQRADGSSYWTLMTVQRTEYDGKPARMFWIYDITERKAGEEELARKEAQLRVALDNMPGGMMLGDQDLNYVLVNSQYSELYEFPEDLVKVGGSLRDELRYQADRGDFGSGEREELVEKVAATYQSGEAVSYERQIAGSGRMLQVRLAPTPDGGYVTIVTDITKRKRAEEELAEKEAHLRVALDNMPGGMVLADRDRKFVFINSQYSELHDYPDGLLRVGGSIFDEARFQAERDDYGPGDTEELIEGVFSQYSQKETVSYERTIANGRTLHFNVAPTPDGGYVVIATDITERKKAEEELAEKEAHLRVALDNMPGGMVLADPGGKFVFVNSQYSELHDYPDGLLKIGGTVVDTVRFQAERGDYGPGEVAALVEQVCAPYDQSESVNYERTLPNGRTLNFNVAPTPDGGYVTIATDITERKQAEEELAEKEALLRLALDNMPGGLVVFDSDFNYVVVNDWIREYYGVPDGIMEAGQPMEGLLRYRASQGAFGPGDIDDLVKKRFEHLRNPEITVFEIAMPDGRMLQFKRQPLEDGGTATIYVDITEIKQAQKALSDQLKFVEALVETIPNPVFVKDTETRYKILNQAWLDAWDVRREDVIGKTVLEFEKMPMEQRRSLQNQAEELLVSGGMRHSETSRLLADDKVHDILYWETAIELGEGNIGGLVGVFVDITDRKNVERDLADKETQLRTVLENMSDGIFMLDSELRYVFFNDRYLELLEIPEGIVTTDKPIFEVNLALAKNGFYGDGDPETHARERTKFYSETEFAQRELELPNGRVLHYRKVPIENDRTVVTVHDISELKEAERVLAIANERMEDELNVGREIQMSMIPLTFPPFPDYDEFSIFAALEPAREVGGDFYDFFFIDDERLCLCVGDVSGKGVPSALFMAVTKTLIKSRAIDDFSTASILSHVNAELSADNKTSMFVTIFMAILNFQTGELVYTSAGHNPPYLIRKDRSLERLDSRHGPVVAAVPGIVYRQDSDTMTAGDMLFMYTDGVTEERNAAGELFSEQRLADLLASATVASVESAVQDTVAAVRDFRGDGNQEDDVTVLAVRFQGSSKHDPIAVFHVTAQNDLAEIAAVIQKFQKFAEEHELPVEVGSRISVIFDDLLNNVISYAFPDGEKHEIDIRTEVAANRLTVTISDDGIPFNPLGTGTPDTSLPLERRVLGGLGIHLVRNLVDDVTYQRRIDRNVLTLVKHIDWKDGTS